mmetsp:Transcript_31413/g.34303  ORF Transcript_31413/g.34303 Transcript_31413/m.34303 type:complete len:128 (+) Transcript_31413:2170-2553(+)
MIEIVTNEGEEEIIVNQEKEIEIVTDIIALKRREVPVEEATVTEIETGIEIVIENIKIAIVMLKITLMTDEAIDRVGRRQVTAVEISPILENPLIPRHIGQLAGYTSMLMRKMSIQWQRAWRILIFP